HPNSLKDPKLKDLKDALVDWINSTLEPEHIVVQSLEEDLFDGLVLHHLLMRLAKVKLPMDEIALTSAAQTHKLEVILGQLSQHLGPEEDQTKWSVHLIHNKDLLATVHLLVAMVKRFQPELKLPPDVEVEVCGRRWRSCDTANALQKNIRATQVYDKAILHFVNKNMSSLGLQVADMDRQFADGVILLLLIGQLEGYFVPLHDFNLTPVNHSEMLHNVTLALDLLIDAGMDVSTFWFHVQSKLHTGFGNVQSKLHTGLSNVQSKHCTQALGMCNQNCTYTTSQRFGHTFSLTFLVFSMIIYIVDSHGRDQNYGWTHGIYNSKQKINSK
uniref:Calponin-homology (CH) domain-containing protein n=1 Tax=Periophthalmus magnuspinnatus TaxID=409849 RepID=A0A3B4B0M1_9GOBI